MIVVGIPIDLVVESTKELIQGDQLMKIMFLFVAELTRQSTNLWCSDQPTDEVLQSIVATVRKAKGAVNLVNLIQLDDLRAK